MAISTTTFDDRVMRIQERAKRVESKRRGAKRSRKGLIFLVTIGMLFGGASLAQGSVPQVDAWADVVFGYVRALLPR
ncbi:MAG TPA: hypothetical protein DC031_00680 [Sulfitobacter sp.]|jgi:hypothetical protein|uniref:Uncharacterized protein n=1 Tax=Sulfitobacter dubius TaxID=218673 RepID=A0ABY3ZNB4_9RHOB|nr:MULTISPECIES: hypothetical protein [Sulfitobacter]MBM07100.1 hypothetical protein [Sulfitobacter sp.]UOA15239.1 hypothetical protein DSM109990_02065 [Sulfitobacter dubius]UOA32212.1 hypothetical protein DSM110093_01998 [Sulfitobacter sp. DSM 110093]WOI29334.1 hypothetical protein R1T39_01080 [Sulfitobacter dubius]SFG24106.1 hypothetical protein SAMN04488039_101212 [Sulfitobacter dubius]|tara:strand:- start:452 stop:682 length:231 start_codon:yes stop_codon:yes gene_type:complete